MHQKFKKNKYINILKRRLENLIILGRFQVTMNKTAAKSVVKDLLVRVEESLSNDQVTSTGSFIIVLAETERIFETFKSVQKSISTSSAIDLISLQNQVLQTIEDVNLKIRNIVTNPEDVYRKLSELEPSEVKE